MRYLGSAVTDAGNIKKTNQDSICVKVANTEEKGQIAMAVICDGMGGLEKGELASATVIRTFSEWFEKNLPKRLEEYSWNGVADEWEALIKNLNQRILNYGKKSQVTLGTTVTALLLMEKKYLIVHVGDTRVYELRKELKQLTEDQTYVAREIKNGTMTLEQARTDSRRNMLLQCIGASKTVVPEIIFGEILPKTVFLLCSDGFRHVITEEEIWENFQWDSLTDVKIMNQKSRQMVDLVKQREERDNISAILIKCME